jgi:hypothetical protein
MMKDERCRIVPIETLSTTTMNIGEAMAIHRLFFAVVKRLECPSKIAVVHVV